MSGYAKITTLITRLREIDISESSEQATREIIVNPMIAALGWDTFNPHEVAREHSVLGGRVDYCLRSKKKNLVFIEVKRVGTDLGDHQEQLLRYAFDGGVPSAVLTDGLVWWLYLPMAGGNWLQRRFSEISLQKQKPAEAAQVLHCFLSQDRLESGAALNEAERVFKSQELDRQIRAALNDAWQQILNDPKGLLPDLLSEEVEKISGHKPDERLITEFLRKVSEQLDNKIPQSSPSKPYDKGKPKNPTPKQPRTSLTRLKAFWLDRKRHEVKTWRGMLVKLCEELANEAGPTFAKHVIELKGRKRPYFSHSEKELRVPHQIPGTRLYVETNISASQAKRIAQLTMRKIRGSDKGFRIEA